MAEVELGKRRELLEIADSRTARRTGRDLDTFLRSSERRARLSRQERLRIVEQALVLMEMNYVHLPMKRAIHAIDPIQQLKLLKFQLAEGNVVLESTIDFHRRLLSIFGSTRDLHTLYLLPEPYRSCTAYLPFLVEQCFERGAERFIVTRTAVPEDAPPDADDDGREARFERGVEVLAWNGVPIVRAIEINGESQAGSNPDARFARGLDNLTIRPLNTTLPPDELWVDILYRAKNGVVATHREYWLVHKTSDTSASSTPHSKKRAALDLKRTRIIEVKKKLYPRDASATLGSIKDILYAVKKTVDGQTVGYIRLFSFDVDDARRFLRAFTKLITKEGFPQDGLILDVRGNPGGNIRAAESLLQLFTPNTIQPELFEFINTPLNFQICKSAPGHWDLQRWLPSIGESVLTGATYSAGFPLTLDALGNGIGQVYYGPVVLITDALSYSATDIFAAGFQDNEVGQGTRYERQHRSRGSELLVAGRPAAGAEQRSQVSVQEAAEGSRDDRGHASQHAGRSARRFAAGRVRCLARRAAFDDQTRRAGRQRRSPGPCRTAHSAATVVPAVADASERQRDCGQRRVEGSFVEDEPGDLPRRCLREWSTSAFHRRCERYGPADSGGDRQRGQHAHHRRSAGVGSRWTTRRRSSDERPVMG